MSLEIIPWYIVDTDKATIVNAGTVQQANLGEIAVLPGQTLRSGVRAHPLEMYEKNGVLFRYTEWEKAKRRAPPARGYVWRAGIMGWEDRRPIAAAKEDKINALMVEHVRRKKAPILAGGQAFHIGPDDLHRVNFAAQAAPATLRPNDMRWRDADGNLKVWTTAAAFKLFAQGLATAAAQQFADVDRWKDDLLDRINAAKLNSDIDKITW